MIAQFCDWLSKTPVSVTIQSVPWVVPAVGRSCWQRCEVFLGVFFHMIPGQRPSDLPSPGHRPGFVIPNVSKGPTCRPFAFTANDRPFTGPSPNGRDSSRADGPG